MAFEFTQRLFEEGVFATPAIYPAVRYGEAIVRTSYMATHTEQDLDSVLEVFTPACAASLALLMIPLMLNLENAKRMYLISVSTSGEKQGAVRGASEMPHGMEGRVARFRDSVRRDRLPTHGARLALESA